MRTKAELLAELNQDLPDRDWRRGAQDYLKFFFEKYSQGQIEEFVFTRPLGQITPEDPVGAITETAGYLHNFASSIQLLQLKRGARVLDVACGGGWFAHWMRKLGYDAYGMDISSDFIAMARQRLQADPYVFRTTESPESIFRVQDFETDRLPDDLRGSFDAIVLESCLHHFFDPVAAMTHIAEGLAPGGVVLVLEGENRQGPIRDEYMQVMLETATLERPYPRILLRELLEHAGLPHVEFLGALKGYFAESAWLTPRMTEHLADSIAGSNICVCGRDAASVQRLVPSYGLAPVPAAPVPAPRRNLSQRVALSLAWRLRTLCLKLAGPGAPL